MDSSLRYTDADEAARLMVRYQLRYRKIVKYFAEITELWHAVANTHLEGSLSVEPLDEAEKRFTGTILGCRFEGKVEPQLSPEGVVGKLTISTRDANDERITTATYLFTADSDVHSEAGHVLITRQHPNCEFLWLIDAATSTISAWPADPA